MRNYPKLTVTEKAEKLLRGGLDGYDEYMQKVRWRLIPLVW